MVYMKGTTYETMMMNNAEHYVCRISDLSTVDGVQIHTIMKSLAGINPISPLEQLVRDYLSIKT